MDKKSDSDSVPPTKKPKTGRFKDTAGRLRQGKENHLSHRASLDWRLDRDRVCNRAAPVGDGSGSDDRIALEEIGALMLKSRTGEMLLRDASERGLKIFFDPQTPQSQFYPRGESCVIVLNPERPRGDLIGTLGRELRRAWQYYRGALTNPMSFEPDEAVLVNRAQQADAFMMSVKFFEGSCTKAHDKRIIHQMLLDDAGYMKVAHKGSRADMDLFRKLGELPQGANYLSIRSKRAPTDMCYSTVEDRSNANFLWFIKFERSFQEKELQMLQASVKTSAQIIDLASWSHSSGHART